MFRHFRTAETYVTGAPDREGFGGIVEADRHRRFTAATGGGRGEDGVH
jgi:hypothetical protein